MSSEPKRFRFLDQVRGPSERMIEKFTDTDYAHEAAFVAVTLDDSRKRIVGESRYSTDQDGRNCECAVTVSDEWKDKGLGTLLMKHLIEVARARGIRSRTSIDSADNIQMKDDANQVIHKLDLRGRSSSGVRCVQHC